MEQSDSTNLRSLLSAAAKALRRLLLILYAPEQAPLLPAYKVRVGHGGIILHYFKQALFEVVVICA